MTVATAEQPHECFPINPPLEAQLDDNEKHLHDHRDQPEHLETPTAGSPPVVEANTATKEPPSPPDIRPEASSEPMTMKSRTTSLDPTPDSGEVGTGKELVSSEQIQAVFGTVEVSRRLIK